MKNLDRLTRRGLLLNVAVTLSRKSILLHNHDTMASAGRIQYDVDVKFIMKHLRIFQETARISAAMLFQRRNWLYFDFRQVRRRSIVQQFSYVYFRSRSKLTVSHNSRNSLYSAMSCFIVTFFGFQR